MPARQPEDPGLIPGSNNSNFYFLALTAARLRKARKAVGPRLSGRLGPNFALTVKLYLAFYFILRTQGFYYFLILKYFCKVHIYLL